MSVFDTMAATLFADVNMASDAIYRAGGFGAGDACRAMLVQPDRESQFGETRLISESLQIEVSTAEVPALAKGDTIEIVDGERYEVRGVPRRDTLRLCWLAEVRAL